MYQAHKTDADGNPAGGTTANLGMLLHWQDGPLAVNGHRQPPNGVFVEDVIAAAIGRLEFYQSSKFADTHNAVALSHLRRALKRLERRTRERVRRGVEGTHQV